LVGWLKPVLRNLETAVTKEGEPLSRALVHYPEIFSDRYIAMVELGESTDLGRSLDRL
jgi:type II secretory pathway component PulF